jgi:DNA-binding transcriptional MerR regulator
MRIHTLAERSGLTIDTLRFYEKRGLLDHNHFERSENGYRAYRDSALERLNMIKHAQAAGFTLSEIIELFDLWDRDKLDSGHIVVYLREKRRKVSEKIAELEKIRSHLDEKLQHYSIPT